MDKAVAYEFKSNHEDVDAELEFICQVPECGQTVKISALRTHAAMAHNTSQYITNMTTVRDDRRFQVKG